VADDRADARPDPEDPAGSVPLSPAFYAGSRTPIGDWWTVLHPPYTAWHLSYVLLGAAVAERVDVEILGWTLLAFFLAVGVSAHALDELKGRPLGTALSAQALWIAASIGLAGAVSVGAYGIVRTGFALLPFIVVGGFLVLAYILEWVGGRVHTTLGFGLAWGAFPALTSSFAQQGRVSLAAALVAAAATGLSLAQRALSTPVRRVRRQLRTVEVRMRDHDGVVTHGDARVVLAPIERALRILSWSTVVLGAGVVVARL
jgi:hypothetical protein